MDYINLNNIYKKKEDFSQEDISKFILENKDNLKEKRISFNYSKITPQNLIGIDEFNKVFFEKIDDIENQISNGITMKALLDKYKLKSIYKENYKLNDETNNENIDQKIFEKIFKNAEKNKLELLDEINYYVLYEINNIQEILPNNEEAKFQEKVKEILFNKSKLEFNKNLITKIIEKKFNQTNFEKLVKLDTAKIKNIKIKSIKDNNKFNIDSIKYLYSLSKSNFAIISDKNNNIYVVKILNIMEKNISKSSADYANYNDQANIKIRDNMFRSYDFFLNDKYKVKINQKTLERVKNYFR